MFIVRFLYCRCRLQHITSPHKWRMSWLACEKRAVACSYKLQLGRQLGMQGRQAHIQRHWRQLRLGVSFCEQQQRSSSQNS